MSKTKPSRAAADRAPEPLLTELLRLLDEAQGLHNRMAADTGVSQTVVSRTFRRQAEPRLTSADAMLRWLRANRHRFDVLRTEAASRATWARARADAAPAKSERTRLRIAALDPAARTRKGPGRNASRRAA